MSNISSLLAGTLIGATVSSFVSILVLTNPRQFELYEEYNTNEQTIASMVAGTRSHEDVQAIEASMHGDWVKIVYKIRFIDKKCTVLMGNGRIFMCDNTTRSSSSVEQSN